MKIFRCGRVVFSVPLANSTSGARAFQSVTRDPADRRDGSMGAAPASRRFD
jgi:hypothetical protein